MKIDKIKGNTFCIDTGVTYIPFYKINDEEVIMLDSGWAKGDRKGIDELLEKNNFSVVGILCTHSHPDHIGNNTHLKKKYNCTIAMPAYEAFICSSPINLKLYYNNQTLSDVKEHSGEMICETDKMILTSQDKVNIHGIEFKILHTPGHSPAHICIITPDDVAYLGDTLISYKVMEGAKMPYAYILKEDLKSKSKLRDLKCSKYIVAHKGIYDNIFKLITDNINFYKNRAEKICAMIDDAMTMEDILKAVIINFNIRINDKYKYIVLERMLRSYIEYLIEIGMIKLNIDAGYLKYSKCSSDV